MGSRLSAPGPQEKRFAAYIEGLAIAAGHEDRQAPLKSYCKGLLLPGERKSIEPMAARLDPVNVQPMRQSLHHLVAKAPWRDEALLEQARNYVLPAMRKQGPVVAWIVDDTGFLKKGRHSVGVARQYCGQVGIQHRMVRPVPLRKNNKDLREFALRPWAGYFDPETLLVANWNPTGTAFVLPRVDDKVVAHQPEQLRATLVSLSEGTIPADWGGSVEIELEPLDAAGWTVAVQVETASGVLVLNKGQDGSHYAPPREDPPAAPGSKLAAIIGTLHHGDPVVIAVTAEYVAEKDGLVTVAGYQQRIEFDLLLSKPDQPLLPFMPVYTVFEDPEYNRALVSQTAYAEGLWLAQKIQHRIRLAFDRREYNANSSFAALFADEDDPKSLQIIPPLGAVLSLKLIRADGTTVPLRDFPSGPNTLIQGSLPQLFIAKTISPVPGDSIAGTLNIVQLSLTDPPVLVQSIATVLVAIVEAPVTPAPQAAYGLLRKNNDAVSCVRFAWSPAATNIELMNPDDLRGETVRRRATFCWRDTVRSSEDYWYAVQKIAPNGSTHSIEDELWIKPDGSGNQE